jgi:hypothetical protein
MKQAKPAHRKSCAGEKANRKVGTKRLLAAQLVSAGILRREKSEEWEARKTMGSAIPELAAIWGAACRDVISHQVLMASHCSPGERSPGEAGHTLYVDVTRGVGVTREKIIPHWRQRYWRVRPKRPIKIRSPLQRTHWGGRRAIWCHLLWHNQFVLNGAGRSLNS